MPPGRLALSGYQSVWLFAMFDLPVETREDKLRYVRFRKALLAKGFTMLQYSIYARFFTSEEAGQAQKRKIKAILPPEGEVRLLMVTDRQFGKMEIYQGKMKAPAEKPPEQLMLF